MADSRPLQFQNTLGLVPKKLFVKFGTKNRKIINKVLVKLAFNFWQPQPNYVHKMILK
jgi:hypothetical protein